jgi:hypothetical protein
LARANKLDSEIQQRRAVGEAGIHKLVSATVSIIITAHFGVAATFWAYILEVSGSNIGRLLSTLIET